MQGNLNRTVGALQLTASVASIVENVLGNFNSNVGAVTAQLVKGNVGETVAGTKNLTSTAAELHVLKGSYTGACDASVTTMVGGLHYQKINGDFAVSGKMITLLGAVGDFKAGGSVLKLGGGPITMKGSVVMHQGAMLVRAGASLKMGTG